MDEMYYGDFAIKVPQHPKADRLRENAEHYAEHMEQLDTLKMSISYLKESLLSDLPEEAGEYPITLTDGRILMITIPEKWEWDKKLLKDIYEASGLPECVNQSFTVDRKKFEASDDVTKAILKKALTIKCGAPTIKVLA